MHSTKGPKIRHIKETANSHLNMNDLAISYIIKPLYVGVIYIYVPVKLVKTSTSPLLRGIVTAPIIFV